MGASDQQAAIGVAHLPHLVAVKLAAVVDVKPIEGLSHELSGRSVSWEPCTRVWCFCFLRPDPISTLSIGRGLFLQSRSLNDQLLAS
jgi:hypothetical protein